MLRARLCALPYIQQGDCVRDNGWDQQSMNMRTDEQDLLEDN